MGRHVDPLLAALDAEIRLVELAEAAAKTPKRGRGRSIPVKPAKPAKAPRPAKRLTPEELARARQFLAGKRLREVWRILGDRRTRRVDTDAAGVVAVIANASYFAAAPILPKTLAGSLRRYGVAVSCEMMEAAIRQVVAEANERGVFYGVLKGRQAGELLRLHLDELKRCSVVYTRACNETDEQWAARRKADAKTKRSTAAAKVRRAKREAERRLAKGAKPHSESLAQTKPWKVLGVSRATFYRHHKPKV